MSRCIDFSATLGLSFLKNGSNFTTQQAKPNYHNTSKGATYLQLVHAERSNNIRRAIVPHDKQMFGMPIWTDTEINAIYGSVAFNIACTVVCINGMVSKSS